MYFMLFLILISSVFSFEISNENGQRTNYFSLNSPIVVISSVENVSNFSVSYKISNSSYSKIYELKNCGSNFCANFSLLDLMDSSNGTFLGATKFNITLKNETENVFLDLEKPSFTLDSSSIIDNSNGKYLNLNYNYSDNSGKFSGIYLYQIVNSDYILVGNLINTTSYNYTVDKAGNITLLFKVIDISGNEKDVEKTFEINDIFNPKIDSYKLIFENGVFKLRFKVEDDNLNKYIISQGNSTLSSTISGKVYENEIFLPFTKGKINFEVEDKYGNSVNKTLNLDFRFSNSYSNKYSNTNDFHFTSNAESCQLDYVNSMIENTNMTKNGNEFSVNLDVSQNKNYKIGFHCENENFEQYYESYFYYDTEKPEKSLIDFKKLDNGKIELNWSESKDNQSNVKYYLYKNGNEIYSGLNLDYIDSKVNYPNLYSYYVVVSDEAGNKVKSNIVSVIPKKVSVNFLTNIKNNSKSVSKNFSFSVNSEKNTKINIVLRNNNSVKYNFTNNDVQGNSENYNLNLSEGENYITILVVDNFNNSKKKEYKIIYVPKKKIIVKKSETTDKNSNSYDVDNLTKSKDVNAVMNEMNLNRASNNSQASLVSEKNISSTFKKMIGNNGNVFVFSFYTYLIFFIIIIFLVAFFMGNRSSGKIDKKKKLKRKVKKTKNDEMFLFLEKKREKDSGLSKTIEKEKQNKIKKEEEEKLKKRMELFSRSKRKELSEFQKKKLEELKKKANPDVFKVENKQESFNTERKRKSNKRLFWSFGKEQSEINDGLNVRNRDWKKSSEKKKNENFDEYLQKVKRSKSWESPKEYLMRTLEERQKRIDDENIRRLREKMEQEDKKRRELQNLQEKEEKKLKEIEEKQRIKQEKILARQSLDDYLKSKTSKKKFYFAELSVNKDLKKKK